MSPFKVIYWTNPLSTLDVVPKAMEEKPHGEESKRVEEIQKFHELVMAMIGKSNASYQAEANKHKKSVVCQTGDLVWIHLRKEHFLRKHKSKLMPRADGSFEISEGVNGNTYKVIFLGDFGVSSILNVAYLSPYLEDDHLVNLNQLCLTREDEGS